VNPQVQIPPKLIPVFTGKARYRGSYGGRGSAKTKTFAKMAAVRALMFAQADVSGIILCGREYQNTLDESSFAEVKHAIKSEDWLSAYYDIGEKYIRTKCGRVHFSFQGLRHNIDSIKSKARILILWVDEADPVSEACWRKVIPTVREQDTEIWVTWNPEIKGSATDVRFRLDPPNNSKIVEMNWRDNPWFTGTLDLERLEDKEKRPHNYEHVWEGGYLEVKESAYYTDNIIKAKEENRWGIDIPEDPLLTIRLWCDIGGTGAKADNFVFWAGQFSGDWINYTNHYEVQGQPIGAHLNWLRENKYTPDRAQIWLPHDGTTNDRVYDVSYESALKQAGYSVTIVPNQGKGASNQRIEVMRNNFNRMRFDNKCEAGMASLAWYHEKIDSDRRIGLGPNHDWSSHSCDAIAIAPITYKPPKPQRIKPKPRVNVA
jgi:phage terminase large subunit